MSNKITIEQTEYGTNKIGKPYRSPEGTWFRDDEYTSNDTGMMHPERRFALDGNDLSPVARTMYAGKGNCNYHPKCSCCYLGFSHTLELHNRNAVGSWD